MIKTTAEAPGVNCTNGGQKVQSGLDDGTPSGTANNGILEAGEVDATAYVCNGATGPAGSLTAYRAGQVPSVAGANPTYAVVFSTALPSASYAVEITVTKFPTSTPDFRPCYAVTLKTTTGFSFQPRDCKGVSLSLAAGETTFDWLAIEYQ